MGKKNKNRSSVSNISDMKAIEQYMEQVVEEERKKVATKQRVPIDKAVLQLLKKTATRNKLEYGALLDFAVQAMLGSIEDYGYNPMGTSTERKATIGTKEESSPAVTVSPESMEILSTVGVFFGAKVCDLLQDAIMAQRFNWQRLQPVNARAMNSIRLEMFRLEQLGPRA